MMTLLLMDLGVTASAKREEIFQCIVAKFLGRGHSSAVNMVNVKILGSTTAPTGEVVAFQSCLPVAPKAVIVFGPADVFIPLRTFLEGLSVPSISQCFGAALAAPLRTRTVNEIRSAVFTLQRRANSNSAFLLTQLAQMKNILLLPVNRAASVTALLGGSRRLVEHLADDALALLETIAGLAMGRQGTRFASLQVGRCLRHLRSAIGAIEDAVLPRFHNLNNELSLL